MKTFSHLLQRCVLLGVLLAGAVPVQAADAPKSRTIRC